MKPSTNRYLADIRLYYIHDTHIIVFIQYMKILYAKMMYTFRIHNTVHAQQFSPDEKSAFGQMTITIDLYIV